MKLTLTINGTEIEARNEGTTLVIKAERGEYRDEGCWTKEPTKQADMPRMLHDAIAVPLNGTTVHTFEEWEELWYSGDETKDRQDYEIERRAAEAWKAVSDLDPKDIWDKLEEIYGEF